MSRKDKCRELCCSTRFLVFATLVVVGCLVVAFTVGGKDDDATKTAFPSGDRSRTIGTKIVAQGITEEATLKNADSHAHKALHWLAMEDEAQLATDDPNLMARYTLAVLYYSTQPADQESPLFQEWKNENKWMSKASVCEWHGIDCEAIQDNKDIVVHVNLASNQLQGTIPSELQALKDLVQLNLSGNRLQGSIPEAIGHLKFLNFLMLQDNHLSGNLPASFGNLLSAEEIFLSKNKLQGSLPVKVGQLPKLRGLKVDHNYFTGSLPPTWDLDKISTLQAGA